MSEMKLWSIRIENMNDEDFIVRAATKEEAEKVLKGWAPHWKLWKLLIYELKVDGSPMVLCDGGFPTSEYEKDV